MTVPDLQTIEFAITDTIATIQLNRPDAANGMNVEMMRELLTAVTHCDGNKDIRAIILTGNGKMFSAGGDLRYFASLGDGIRSALSEMATLLHACITRFAHMEKPLIIAVNGMAAGGGLSLAMAGDIVLAAESSQYTMAYTGAGLTPDGSSSYFLPRLVGLRRTQELMLTNRRLTAAEALEWGMVTRVVSDADLLPEARKLAQQLAQGPTQAYGTVKRLLAESFNNGMETQMELEGRAIAAQSESREGQEGITAFLQKRAPQFASL